MIDAQKLKISFGKLEGLLAPLVVFLLLGMFLTSMAAVTACVLLYAFFKALIASGLNPVSSAILVALIVITVFIAGGASMYHLSRRLSGRVHTATRTGKPLMGQVGQVAESFISGLLQSDSPTVTRGPQR